MTATTTLATPNPERAGIARPDPGDEEFSAPVSFSQQRLWLLDRLLPAASTYNNAYTLRVVGELDVSALRRALNEIVRRHEVLRTRFAMIDGEPVQRIMLEVTLDLEVNDLSALPATEREAEARRQVQDTARQPFDLERAPPNRARLLRLAPNEHWLSLALHHIATDAWSVGVLARELSLLYGAMHRGEASPLAELPVQYADYAMWQREWLQGEVLERQLGYWKKALADVPLLQLPTDRPRPAIGNFRAGHAAFELDETLTLALKELSRREGATLSMTLLAAFQVLLHRYSGQDDMAVGVPTAGRDRPELEGLIGFFINMLVVRGDLSGEPTFRAYLARVRQASLDAYDNQDLPFEKLVEELAPRRDLSRNPLFQVCFGFQNTAPAEWQLPGLDVYRVDGAGNETAKFDLHFAMRESAGMLRGRIEYAADLFDAATVERMVGQWRLMLEAIVANPDQHIDRLPLQTRAERDRVLVEWNRTATDYPADASVHALFEAQVERAPEAVALIDEGRQLSYRELNTRANALAHYVRGKGVGPGALVGVCMERSADSIVALLAILKAGAAYVPLDPALPRERLAYMLEDLGQPLVLTEQRFLARLPESAGRVLCLDRDRAQIETSSSANPGHVVRAQSLAYIMYTSGSTGDPKGVAIPHRAIVRLTRGTDYLRLGPGDTVAHSANPAFDATTFEIWGALLNGARLAVIPHETLLSPRAFAAALDRNMVTALFLTTALFNHIARDAPAAFRGRDVLFGGEAVEPRWVQAALRGGAPRRLLHVYGPTETTTFATWHEVRASDPNAATVPIGRPLANTEVYILDRHREPVPVGVPGEIYIGGPGLALGYHNRPELSAERFVAHPFDPDPEARVYRTGDRARYQADGVIEFLGRLDRQVKIRGYRIEPAEVEAALLRLPQVREAVVQVQGDTSDTRQLTAYVVAAEGATPTPSDLWQELRRILPDYMVPAAIVILVAMPLTPNGKIDRGALPTPSDLAEQRTGWHLAPRDHLEQMLAAIWEELLSVRNIGVRDNFFDVGGHSLLAAQMVESVERATGCRVPLTTLFTGSTIEDFAQAMRDIALQSRAPVIALNATGSRPPFFFLHGDFTGGGFFSHKLARALGPEQPFYAVHPHGLIDDRVPASIEAMAAERLVALREARPRGPYLLGGHCAGAMVALEMARQLVREGEDVPLVVLIDAVAPRQAQRIFPGVTLGADVPRPRRKSIQPTAEPEPAGDAFARYRHAMRHYAPAPYPGRIVLLRPEARHDSREFLGWSPVSSHLQMHIVPGDHSTAITQHIESTAARLRECIDEVTGEPGNVKAHNSA